MHCIISDIYIVEERVVFFCSAVFSNLIAILGMSSSIVMNVPTRYLLVAGTNQSFQIVVGTFALQK